MNEQVTSNLKHLIIDLEGNGQVFYDQYLRPLGLVAPDIFTPPVLEAVYQEVGRQIFDCMNKDFVISQRALMTKPDFNLLIGADFFHQNEPFKQGFRKGFLEFGLAAYFLILRSGCFLFGETIFLDQIERNLVLVVACFDAEDLS